MVNQQKIMAVTLSVFLLFFSLYCISLSDEAVWSFNQNNLSRIIVIWQEDDEIREIYEPEEVIPYVPVFKIYP
ncbi:hypothetical protein [Candidatus Contubernalis alkaliaceticus]|uniref:hypothetical protein n=1 Tax=Candidatus Contubernalis alkaliaceticus TaxID=338645 RepID=UPI001F4C368C|nr:hypothetical protein [Candidatus Contubernalis alkalaceticus]UNC92867.1 hypothetical protein HUE98_12620 [Candidatus Contubernalis alkalaceticus]